MNTCTDCSATYAASSAMVAYTGKVFQMGPSTVKVLGRITRNSGAPLEGREGYAYTIELTDENNKKNVREVFMFSSEGKDKDYTLVDFVAVGAEGDNFYKTPRAQRWSDDPVTPEIKEALDLFDHPSKAKKKHDIGNEARARLCAGGCAPHQYKPS